MLFNTERKTETLRVLVLLLLLTLSCRGQSQLIGSSQPIVAALGDDIILPCLLVPAEDASDLTLEWARPDLNPRFVHLWRSGVELMAKKHQSFKGRTSLFIDELKVGNISLKLSNVTLADRGTYKCFLPGLDRQTLVQLVVGAASPPVLTLSGIDGDKGGVVLDCESRGWYPEPEVLWLDAEGNLLSAGPTETVRGPDDLYTVSSRVTVERHSNSFTCRVHQKSTTQTRDTHIRLSEDFFKVPPSSVPIITGLAVCLTGCFLLVLLLLFVVWRWRPTRTKNKAEDEPVTEGREREREREREQLMKLEDQQQTVNAQWVKTNEELKETKLQLETKEKELETKQTEMEKVKEELENKKKELVTARQKQGRSFFSLRSRSEPEQQQEVETLKEEMETQQKESNMKIKELEDQQQTVNAQWMKTNEELKETKLQLETKEKELGTIQTEMENLKEELERKELVTARQKQGRRFFSLRGRSEEEQQQEVETQKEKMETQQKKSNKKIKLEDQQQTVNTQWMKTNEELKETKLQLETKRGESSQLKRELHKLLFDEQKKKEKADKDMKEQLFIEQKKKEKADEDMKELLEENIEWDKKLNEETRRRKEAEREVETLKEELNEETRRRKEAEREVETLKEELSTKPFSNRLSGVGSRWEQAQQADPGFPLTRNTSQLILGDPKVFPGQLGDIIPSACPGSSPRSPPSWTCPENHPGLPVHGHSSRPPYNIEKTCQPRQPNHVQRDQHDQHLRGADLIHPWSFATKYQNQNPEETTTREEAEKQVETPQKYQVSSQRPHQDSSSANHNSTPGSVFVIDVDQQGKYIRVRNTSYQEQHLGGWRLEMMINRKKYISYSFHEFLKLKSGQTLSMSGPDCGRSSSSVLWWTEFRPFNSADELNFTLINISTDKRYDLNSYSVNN